MISLLSVCDIFIAFHFSFTAKHALKEAQECKTEADDSDEDDDEDEKENESEDGPKSPEDVYESTPSNIIYSYRQKSTLCSYDEIIKLVDSYKSRFCVLDSVFYFFTYSIISFKVCGSTQVVHDSIKMMFKLFFVKDANAFHVHF